MTTPSVRFHRPRNAFIDLLDAGMEQPVGTEFPTEAQLGTKADKKPGYLQVAWDGTPTSEYPVTIRTAMRVTAWHWDPTPAEDLALDALAVLGGSAGGTDRLWTVKHLTGPLTGTDRATGYRFASCTYRVQPKPASVA